MDILLASPLPAQIEACIHAHAAASDIDQLRLVSALLKYTVPEVYASLSEQTQNAVAGVFRSAIGLGNLFARIAMFSKLRADLHHDVVRSLNSLLLLLGRVLQPGLLRQLWPATAPIAQAEVEKLLFKGRAFAIVRETAYNFPKVHVPAPLKDLPSFTAYLSRELLLLPDAGSLVMSVFSLGEPNVFFDITFMPAHLEYLRTTCASLKRFERKLLLLRYLDFIVFTYLRVHADADKIGSLAILGKVFLDNAVWDDLLLEKIAAKYNYSLDLVVSLMVEAPKKLAQNLLSVWGNVTLLANEPIVKQAHRTHLLLALCRQLPAADLEEIMKLQEFVAAISNRLSSLSNLVKHYGMILADTICIMAAKPPIFDMDSMSLDSLPDMPLHFFCQDDFNLSVEDAWDALKAPQVVELSDLDLEQELQPLSIEDRSAAVDLDLSDEEDDPSLAQNKKVAAPIYVRDLLSYITIDVKDKTAFEKRQIALRTAPTLLRQKLAFGTEVSFFAEDLISNLVALTNHFEEANFETLRLNAMIAVVVSYPAVTLKLCNLLLTGDYSLQQRICLLSTMSFAARALKGFKDDEVAASFMTKSFATQQLPSNLHNFYEQTDIGYSRIENAIQSDLMEGRSEDARDQLAGGRILRISSKLKPTLLRLIQKSDDLLESFPKIVGKSFFFPLVAVWYESGGINIGHYTPLLVSHFIRSLSLILHCAYPTAVDLNDMAGEYLNLVTPVLQNVSLDQLQVVESIATGIMLICETIDEIYLVTHFEGNLVIVENCILAWWESLIDDRVKSLCAGLLLRLADIRKNMQKVLMSQMNGAFYS